MMILKPLLPCLALSLGVSMTVSVSPALAASSAVVAAETQAAIARGDYPTWWSPTLPEDVQSNVASKAKGLAESLKLEDAAQTQAVAGILAQHFARVWAWHQDVDTDLDAAWSAWDEARNNLNGKEKDELKALAIATEQIDPIHAQFTPQIQGMLRDLRAVVGDEKTTALVDRYTRSPGAPRTYNAYLEMVPEMTDAEKAILWDRMVQAREEAMSAWSGKQIIKIFKKYKVRNEFSMDYFGYGYRQRYDAWNRAKK